jgi:glycosyltransferase involved in cell wall biosynthesis
MAGKRSRPLIVIVQRIVPYYRVPFFNLLANANPELEINIYHGSPAIDGNVFPSFRSFYRPNYILNLFGYSLVLQPRLMLDVLLASPDLLVLEGTFGVITNFVLLLWRWLIGRPTLYWTAGWNNPAVRGWKSLLKSLFIRVCLSFCNGAIVYGSTALEYLAAHGLSKNRIIIAQNTIDVEALTNRREQWRELGDRIRQKYFFNSNKVIVYVGQLTPIKRVDILLNAFFALRTRGKDVMLLLVGDGGQAAELKRFVETRQISGVHFAGEVVDDVEACFSAGDVFVLPGTGGLALNQAMALGLPVIATVADGTEADLIVPGENGYIVPVDDADALADAIDKILGSPQLQKEMGQNSLRIILEKATLQNMVENYSTAFKKGLGGTLE